MKRECLSVIMPVYNEKDIILEVIDKVLQLEILKELVIIDDGSTDGTKESLQEQKFSQKVRCIFHEKI